MNASLTWMERTLKHWPAVGLVLALLVIIALAKRSRASATEIARLRMEQRLSHVGRWVAPAAAVTINGDTVKIGQPGRRQVLFFFSSTCAFCEQSLKAWTEIAQRIAQDTLRRVDVIGVALDSLPAARQYALVKNIAYPVAMFVEPRDMYAYGARAVPFTVVVGEEGRMAYARPRAVLNKLTVDSVVAVALARAPTSSR